MSAIGAASEPVVFEAFRAPAYSDRSQYTPQVGSSYTQLRDEPQRMDSPESSNAQFDVVFTGTSKVAVTAGYVRCVNPDAGAGSSITDWEPTIDGVPLFADPPPEITVAAGQVLYCEVKTNNKGIVEETPRIVVGPANDTGAHYQPPQLNPQNGSLRYPIAKFEQDGDDLIAIQLQQGGPILVQPTLWEGRNVGGFREIYKERQNTGDYYEFRTLEQLEVDSSAQEGLLPVAVLKPIGDEGEGDSVKVRFLSPKPTTGSGSDGEEAQIQVTETDGGDGIIVRGNDVKVDVDGAFLTALKVRDGLVVEADTVAFGYNGPISITDGCGSFLHTLNFSDGILREYTLTAIAP